MQISNTAKPDLIWLNMLVFSLTSLIAVIGVPLYAYFYDFHLSVIIAAMIATVFCGLSITAGYHRLWSHKAYAASPVVRFIFALGGAFSVQNSALHWSADHRRHHRYVDDNEKDPYSAKRGFWYSHMGWMLREYHEQDNGDYSNVKDLQRDPIVMWQHKYYLSLVLLMNVGVPIVFGLINGYLVESLLLVGFVRLVVSHHVTFFINSLAHMWGRQPYSDQNTAKDNPVVAFFTYGEGYHNYHHAFQYDYRNAIKWWQYDPTKWLIKSMSWLGLASNLKKVSEEKIAKSIAKLELNKAQNGLLERSLPNTDEALASMQKEYEQLLEKMSEFYQVKKEWVEGRKDQLCENVESTQLSQRYQELKKGWFEQQKSWHMFIHQYV